MKKIITQQQLYTDESFDPDALEALVDFSTVLDFLAINQDELNSRLVDHILDKYYLRRL